MNVNPCKGHTPPRRKKATAAGVTRLRVTASSPGFEPSQQPRQFLIEVYGPLFGAIGRVTLPSPVRLSDFVNERDAFLRLADVEFPSEADWTPLPRLSRDTECFLNKGEIEMICQPQDEAVERLARESRDHGTSLWQAFSKMSGPAATDLRVQKQAFRVQVQTHRFTIGGQIHIAHGAQLGAVLSNMQTKFLAVTEATARFNHDPALAAIERTLILINRDHILLVALDRERPAAAAA